jgi:hypothetical protein
MKSPLVRIITTLFNMEQSAALFGAMLLWKTTIAAALKK